MQNPASNFKIVIADDDNTTRQALKYLLQAQGHRVVGEAQDGRNAVELCRTLDPDIVFLDIEMPYMDGNEVSRQVRAHKPGIGVIMVSAISTVENVRAAVRTGVNGFVVKPFTQSKLLEALSKCEKQIRRNGASHANKPS